MANQTYDELSSIKRQIDFIVNELEEISNGVLKDFTGIGNEKCSLAIHNMANYYREVSRKFNGMDISDVMKDE